MNQAELRTLTEERLLDARALLAGERWSLAYHVTGIAVECALKSCVLARMIYTGWVFEERIEVGGRERKVTDLTARSHDFEVLIDLAGLRSELDAARKVSLILGVNWNVAASWRVDSRYTRTEKADSLSLFEAVTVEPDGVMAWLRMYW